MPGGLNFSIWGASWAHFACLVGFVVALERLECVLEGLGIDCGGLWGAAGWILEASKPYFSQFWLVLAYSCASVTGMLRSLQNTGRSGAKRTSEHVFCPQRDARNDQISALQLLKQEFLPRARGNAGLQRSRSDFGKFWASPRRLLDNSWAFLQRAWAVLAAASVVAPNIFGDISVKFRRR